MSRVEREQETTTPTQTISWQHPVWLKEPTGKFSQILYSIIGFQELITQKRLLQIIKSSSYPFLYFFRMVYCADCECTQMLEMYLNVGISTFSTPVPGKRGSWEIFRMLEVFSRFHFHCPLSKSSFHCATLQADFAKMRENALSGKQSVSSGNENLTRQGFG